MSKKKKYKCENVEFCNIEEVKAFLNSNQEKFKNMYKINKDSLRYKTFFKDENSLSCVKCGLPGNVFGVTRVENPTGASFHFNLYHKTEDGKLILITKDHIVPKSKGGKDYVYNLQTMCVDCNFNKGNDTE